MSSNKKVLIATEFEQLRGTLKRTLIQLGFQYVNTVGDGIDAQGQLRQQHYDLIIADYDLPKISGLKLLQTMRSEIDYHAVPFLIMTADGNRKFIEAAIASGVSGFIMKPFTPKVFAQKLLAVLRQEGGEVASLPPVVEGEVESNPTVGATTSSSATDGLPTVMLIDDSTTNLNLIASMLKGEYRIRAISDSVKALRLLETQPLPDLILLDVMMPQMDGFELCRRFMAGQDIAATVPVIFLTSKGSAEDMAHGLELGAVDYVAKPVTPAVLKARIKNHLRIRRANEELREQLDLMVENARLRDEIVQMTQYDMKQPLRQIMATIGQNSPDKVRQMNDSVCQMIDSLMRTVELLRLEQKYPYSWDRVDLMAVVTAVVSYLQVRAQQQQAKLVFDGGSGFVPIRGEYILCYSLILQLLTNAIEAVSAGAVVTITLKINDKGGQLQIHNPGEVAASMRNCFFDKHSTAGRGERAGLGTYLARLITEAMGGRIVMHSNAESGTTVVVMLPVAVN